MKTLSAAATALAVLAFGRVKNASAQSWGLKGELAPDSDPNLTPDYGFGIQVEIDGGTALIGSFQSGKITISDPPDNVYGQGLGSARVFVRSDPSSSNAWDQEGILIADDGANGDYYGYSVSIDGDTALVGVFRFPDGGVARAFVFVRSAGTWTQEAMLILDDNIISHYGAIPQVDIKGDTAAIGLGNTQTDPDNWPNPSKGKVFVFERVDSVWGPATVLEASDGADGDYFGGSVSISGDSILVGASEREKNFDGSDPERKGKAYVFVRNGTAWDEQDILRPFTTDKYLGFGVSVALDGDTAAIGVSRIEKGEIYIYVRNAGTWSMQTFVSPGPVYDCFGCSVDLKDGNLLIFAYMDGSADGVGRKLGAYLYIENNGSWALQETLKTGAFQSFTQVHDKTVALDHKDPTTALVSDVINVGVGVGSVFVFDDFSPLFFSPTLSPTVDPLSPTGIPTTSSAPSKSSTALPTPDPSTDSLSSNPTASTALPTPDPSTDSLSSNPTARAPTGCNGVGSCIGSCSINPDPHYTTWDNMWYDFQGGCDQYAINNPALEVQIRTRPRTYYSTITQLAVKIQATGEVFRVHIDGRVENTIGDSGAGLATYSVSGVLHRIDFDSTSPASYINVYVDSYGISMQAYGTGEIFGGSEGMCGSFDKGGTLFEDGSRFNLSGNYQDDMSRSITLAANWQVPVATSLLWVPSSICDASSTCGAAATGATFTCDAVRRRLAVNPGCTRTCTDITVPQFREQCEKDVELAGDATWACAPTYVNPVIAIDRVNPGYGEWYVDWSKEHCLQDCATGPAAAASCGGSAENWETLYNDADSCCEARLPYKNSDWCKETSLGNSYPGTGKFYVDHASKICVRDCVSGGTLDGNNDCGEIIEDGYIRVYGTTLECCKAELGWKNADLCASESDPSSTGTLQFYVNQQEKKCVQDCPTIGGGSCRGPPKQSTAQLFATATDCCEEKLSWLSLAKCLEATTGILMAPGGGGGSAKWYVDWKLFTCVKDCVGGVSCGGLKGTWDIGHPSANSCCNMISWVPRDECAR